ncbi:unnamed protein product, partial [Prorocentrum cordatum]
LFFCPRLAPQRWPPRRPLRKAAAARPHRRRAPPRARAGADRAHGAGAGSGGARQAVPGALRRGGGAP